MPGAIALTALLIAAASPADATTHLILFGGSVGFVYSPNSLNVAVGDTVKWQGDFSIHPLSSTSFPVGASSFHAGSGSSFSYWVDVAGTFHYRCDFHFGSGMVGSFTASATGVGGNRISSQPDAVRLEQNYPNPFNARTVIRFSLPTSEKVSLKVYSILGEELATLVDGAMPAGSFTVPFDGSALASGVYYYRLSTDRQSETRRFVLLK